MFRLIRTRTWTTTRRRLDDTEYELAAANLLLAAQESGWAPSEPPVDGDLPAVLTHVDTGVREEAEIHAADHAEKHLDPTNALGLTLSERWTGYPDGSAVHYLGAGRWLHYHPGRAKARTNRSHFFPEVERVCLLDSHRSGPAMEPVAGLAALLELLGANYTNYRAESRAGSTT
ncbi:hypothetical protein [Kitasatospora sp. NPDC057541]|uniref:hypothetical protein n=1 Tax=unclassified Kitasatospora TaxID=2633591 RepID=UPI0036AD84E9